MLIIIITHNIHLTSRSESRIFGGGGARRAAAQQVLRWRLAIPPTLLHRPPLLPMFLLLFSAAAAAAPAPGTLSGTGPEWPCAIKVSEAPGWRGLQTLHG